MSRESNTPQASSLLDMFKMTSLSKNALGPNLGNQVVHTEPSVHFKLKEYDSKDSLRSSSSGADVNIKPKKKRVMSRVSAVMKLKTP